MSLGQTLVSARKSAGLTLEELASRTNIRAALLREFEANDFSHAGGDTYARGHLRSIAHVYGLSGEEFITEFDNEHARAKRAIHEQLVESNVTAAIPEKSKFTYKQLLIFSIIGILSIVVVTSVYNNLRNSATAPKAKPSPTASATPSASPTASATDVKTYSSGTGVEVKLSATDGSSWLNVTDKAGIVLFSGRASQGESYLFTSTEEVNLRVGNAGAVKLTVNGHAVEPIGGQGEVVVLSYGVNS